MNAETKQLAERVQALTGLNERASAYVASTLLDECPVCLGKGANASAETQGDWTECPECKGSGVVSRDLDAATIVAHAEQMGYEFERPKGLRVPPAIAPHMTMDPAEVLDGVYENCPRVLCEQMPRLGRAPDEFRDVTNDLLEQLPEEARLMVVKIDVFEGKATFWLRDEANSIDRPIGPIDVTRYSSERALGEAFTELAKRLDRVLAADWN